MPQFSEDEKRLIIAMGFTIDVAERVGPMHIYRLMVEKAFLEKMDGPVIWALRRGCLSIAHNYAPRLTKEFDELIQF